MSDQKNNHVLLKALGVTAVAGTAAYTGFSYYAFRNIFDLQNGKLYENQNGTRRIENGTSEKSEWFAHSVKDDDFLDSYDGLKLHALRIANHPESHQWILLVHGIGSYSGSLMDYLYEADHEGFNILAVDLRGCGMSSGRYTGLGWNEHYDLISWINYLVSMDSLCQIALVGINLGASAIMNTVGDYIPSNVKCAVEDGGFSDIKQMVSLLIQKSYKVDAKPFLPMIDLCVKQTLHFSMNDVNQQHQLSQSSTPMLFIHGDNDQVVPLSMVYDNYESCHAEKELCILQNAGFNECYLDESYFETVFNYIRRYIA